MARYNEFRLEPKKFRLAFASVLLGVYALTWATYFSSSRFIDREVIELLETRLQSEIVVLEDHVTRSLDTVAARLRIVTGFIEDEALATGALSSEKLYDLIREDGVIRSLSLVDSRGLVLASSNPRNIGFRLPEEDTPQRAGLLKLGEVRFGKTYPLRDIFEEGLERPPASNLSFWLAWTEFAVGEETFYLFAAINLQLFQNLWVRLKGNEGIEIALYDFQGARLVSQSEGLPLDLALGRELARQASLKDRGLFRFGKDNEQLIAYRASGYYPAIITASGERQVALISARASGEQSNALALASTLTIIISLIMLFLFNWYLRYEKSISELNNQARAMGSHLMMSESNRSGSITRANKQFLDVTGYTEAEIIGQNHRIFNSGLQPQHYFRELWETISSGEIWRGTFRNRNKSGGFFWVNVTIVPFKNAWGEIDRYVALYNDVSEAINLSKEYDEERRLREALAKTVQDLSYTANTDALTLLPNRRAFDTFVEKAIEAAKKHQQPISVMVLDLDKFKHVNDTYGHAAGDVVLKEMARRWSQQIRTSDMIARTGGEEFSVLLPGAEARQAAVVAEKIRAVTCAQAVSVPGSGPPELHIPITVSIGLVSVYQLTDDDLTRMLRAADEALYEAKRAGRNRIVARDLT